MLYLPLDGDMLDHSGIGRHGQVPSGQQPPSFTCLDKSINCSALFTEGQCITIPSLATVPFTSSEVVEGSVAQVPKASFVVHFKRVPNGPPTKQGRWFVVLYIEFYCCFCTVYCHTVSTAYIRTSAVLLSPFRQQRLRTYLFTIYFYLTIFWTGLQLIFLY